MIKNTLIIALFLCNLTGFTQNYKVSKTVNYQGNDTWDYLAVDEDKQVLFVSHGLMMNIIDLKTFKNIATILETKEVHGVALAPDFNKLFISNGKENTIAIYDKNTFEFIQKLKIEGIRPDYISYDKFSRQIYVSNSKSNNLTIIDPNKEVVKKTIPLGGKPNFSVSNNKGLVYVAIEDKNQIKVIDTSTLEIVSTWTIGTGEKPIAMTIDSDTGILFIACKNNLMVILEASTGKVITTLPIGEDCNGAVFYPKEKLVFASNAEGTMTVIKEYDKNTFEVHEVVPTQRGAKTIAINKAINQLYLPTAKYMPIETFDKKGKSVVKTGIAPGSFAIMAVDTKRAK